MVPCATMCASGLGLTVQRTLAVATAQHSTSCIMHQRVRAQVAATPAAMHRRNPSLEHALLGCRPSRAAQLMAKLDSPNEEGARHLGPPARNEALLADALYV
jgi:hypothetical protein